MKSPLGWQVGTRLAPVTYCFHVSAPTVPTYLLNTNFYREIDF